MCVAMFSKTLQRFKIRKRLFFTIRFPTLILHDTACAKIGRSIYVAEIKQEAHSIKAKAGLMCWSWQMCFQSLGFHLMGRVELFSSSLYFGRRGRAWAWSGHICSDLFWSAHIWAAWQLVVDEEHLLTVPVYQQLQFVKEEGRGGGGGGGRGGGGGGGCDAPSSSLSTRPWRRLPSISLLAASQDHHPNNSTRLLNPKTFGIASWPSAFQFHKIQQR